MSKNAAILKLENSNQGLHEILEDIDQTFVNMRSDPKLKGLVGDLENLFYAYLKTWIKSNSDIVDLLKKDLK
jgi:hypothetical protein